MNADLLRFGFKHGPRTILIGKGTLPSPLPSQPRTNLNAHPKNIFSRRVMESRPFDIAIKATLMALVIFLTVLIISTG